ncbi:MAG: hypothetical protein WC785_02665 [Tatlockia sp.]|jgi:hypothetical protein
MSQKGIINFDVTYEILNRLHSRHLIAAMPTSSYFLAIGYQHLINRAVAGDRGAKHYLLNYIKSCYASPRFLHYINPIDLNLFLNFLIQQNKQKKATTLALAIQLRLGSEKKIVLSPELFETRMQQLKSFYLNQESYKNFFAMRALHHVFEQIPASFTPVNQTSPASFEKKIALHQSYKKTIAYLIRETCETKKKKYDNAYIKKRIQAISYFLPDLSEKQKNRLLNYLVSRLLDEKFVLKNFRKKNTRFDLLLAFCIKYLFSTMAKRSSEMYQQLLIRKNGILCFNNFKIAQHHHYLKIIFPIYMTCLEQSNLTQQADFFNNIIKQIGTSKKKAIQNSMTSFMITFATTCYRFGYIDVGQQICLQIAEFIPYLSSLSGRHINQELLNELHQLNYSIKPVLLPLHSALKQELTHLFEKTSMQAIKLKTQLLSLLYHYYEKKEYQSYLTHFISQANGLNALPFLNAKDASLLKNKFFTSQPDATELIKQFHFFTQAERNVIARNCLRPISKENAALNYGFMKRYHAYIPEAKRVNYFRHKINSVNEYNYDDYEDLFALFPDTSKLFCEKLLSIYPRLNNAPYKLWIFITIARFAHLLDPEKQASFAGQINNFFDQAKKPYKALKQLANFPAFKLAFTNHFDYFLTLHSLAVGNPEFQCELIRQFSLNYPFLKEKDQNTVKQLVDELIVSVKRSPKNNILARSESKLNVFQLKKSITTIDTMSALPQWKQDLISWMQGDAILDINRLKKNAPYHAVNKEMEQWFMAFAAIAHQFFGLEPLTCAQETLWEKEDFINQEWCLAYLKLALFHQRKISLDQFEYALKQVLLPFTTPEELTPLQKNMRLDLQQFIKTLLFARPYYITATLLQCFNHFYDLFELRGKNLVFHLLEEALNQDNAQDLIWHKRSIATLKTLLEKHDEKGLSLFFKPYQPGYVVSNNPLPPFDHFMQKVNDIPRDYLIDPYYFSENIVDLGSAILKYSDLKFK